MIATNFDVNRLKNKDRRLTSLLLSFTCQESPHMYEQMADLQAALEGNVMITSVVIATDDSFSTTAVSGERTDELMADFGGVLKQIGRLPNLRNIQITSTPSSTGVLPVQALTLLLQETTQLKALVLNDLALSGTHQDFDQLAQQVQRLWFLQRFDCVDIHPVPGGNFKPSADASSPSLQMDALLLSLCMLPSLQTLSLAAAKTNERASISLQAFSALFLSSSIKTLTLQHWKLTDEHVTAMTQLLNGNSALRALIIGPLPDVTPTLAKALANMLQCNTNLLHLELNLSKMLSNESAEILALALHSRPKHTCPLQTFILSGHRLGPISKRCKSAFLNMLQHNLSLRQVVLFRKSVLQDQIAFYTRLNFIGRRFLNRLPTANTKNSTKEPQEIFLRALAHPVVNQDLDSIFYFLSNNPALCSQAVAVQEKKRHCLAESANVESSPSNKRRRL